MRFDTLTRRWASSLLLVGASRWDVSPLRSTAAAAFEVPERTEQQRLEQSLYTTPAPTVVPYTQQVGDAITIRTMRGVWELQEKLLGGSAVGTLTFRGADMEEKGSVAYAGEAAAGRGPWIIKSDGFGRSPTGRGGAIEMKALWKLRRGAEGTYQYTGRINVVAYAPDGFPDATIEGEVISLINGGKPKGGTEKKVGTFRAILKRRLTATEEMAETDGFAAGGAPQNLQVVPLMDERLVNKVN